MYNSNKWSYTFVYIPIHFILFAGFGAKVFWKSIVFLAFVWPKNAAPWAAIIEIKQFTYVIIWDSKFGRCGTMGRNRSNRRGCTSHKSTLFFGHAKQPEKCPQVTLLLVLLNHGLVLLQPQRLIEPLFYTSGSVITVLKGCLAASSNFSLVRFMEPHTSQFKIFWEKNESYVFRQCFKNKLKT